MSNNINSNHNKLFFNVRYIQYLKKNINKNTIIVKDKIIKINDSSKYLEFTDNTILRNGQLHVTMDITELILYNLKNELKNYMNTLNNKEREESDIKYIRLFIEGKKKESYLEAQRKKEEMVGWASDWIRLAAFYKVFHKNNEESQKCFLKAKETAKEDVFILVLDQWAEELAKYAKLLYNNKVEAYNCLKELEKWEKRWYGWVPVVIAVAYKLIFNDETNAIKHLKIAEQRIELIHNKIKLIRAWKRLFNNETESMKIMIELEHLGEWNAVAPLYKELYNNETDSKRCLLKAETIIKKSPDLWLVYAKNWKNIFNDNDRTLKWIKKAENNRRCDWIECCKTWKELFNEKKEAERCLKKAENGPRTVPNLLACADAWMYTLDNEEEAIRCIHAAESDSEYPAEWIDCAKAWKYKFEAKNEAIRCLKLAERRCTSSSELVDCADAWKYLFNDDFEVKRCITKSEKYFQNGELNKIVEAWKYIYNNEAEAKRCLIGAENKADETWDLLECAETWKKIFHNEIESKRCLKEAEKKQLMKHGIGFIARRHGKKYIIMRQKLKDV